MEIRERRNFHSLGEGRFRYLTIVHPVAEPSDGVHASFCRLHIQDSRELAMHLFVQNCPPFFIQHAHPSQVSSKMSFFDKFREHCLFDQRQLAARNGPEGHKIIDQAWRQHEIPQPKGRE